VLLLGVGDSEAPVHPAAGAQDRAEVDIAAAERLDRLVGEDHPHPEAPGRLEDVLEVRVRAEGEDVALVALDEAGHTETAIMAYSAKFNSAYYGPFREAVGSSRAAGTTLLGKDTYQLHPANAREASREVELDLAEGADVVMVKPAGPYLDIIRQTAEQSDRPVAAYQVSGEYAQIQAAAQCGWLDLARCRDESLLAIKRAGADLILTYFARQWVEAASKGDDPPKPDPYDSGGGI